MSHLHKNEDRKKLVLSEAAQDLTKEQHKNDTMLKENNKWQRFSKNMVMMGLKMCCQILYRPIKRELSTVVGWQFTENILANTLH